MAWSCPREPQRSRGAIAGQPITTPVELKARPNPHNPTIKAVRKDVVLGRMVDGLRVVNSGLAANDKVVVHGVQKIFFPGMPVKATPQAAAPVAKAIAAR